VQQIGGHGSLALSAARAMTGFGGRDAVEHPGWSSADAFVEDLFQRHHGEIYAYLVRMMRDPELAADLTQDAFIKAYRAHDTL
jgi:hypothetical protein